MIIIELDFFKTCYLCDLDIGPGVWDIILDYKREQSSSSTINDICHGMCYKETQNSLTGSAVTLLFNTDGVLLYKSSSTNVWPIFAVINELPPSIR